MAEEFKPAKLEGNGDQKESPENIISKFNVPYHTHNGEDSPIAFDSDSDNDYVDLTSAQTVGGVKTFTSIPVLPASNPTTDNQAVRKAYVDSVCLYASASATNQLSAITEEVGANSTTIIKEFQVYVPGEVRISYQHRIVSGNNVGQFYTYIIKQDDSLFEIDEFESSASSYTTRNIDTYVNAGDRIGLACVPFDEGVTYFKNAYIQFDVNIGVASYGEVINS